MMTLVIVKVSLCLALLLSLFQDVQGREGGLRLRGLEDDTVKNDTLYGGNMTEPGTTEDEDEEVGSDIGYEDASETAESSPTLAPTIPRPPNDVCPNAIPLTVMEWTGYNPEMFLQGTTVGASQQQILNGCGGPLLHYGAWYTVMGANQTYTASTCSEKTDLNTVLSVYEGTCDGGWECVKWNDDASLPMCNIAPLASRVQWQAKPGVMYYILIRSFGAVGNFEVSVEGYQFNAECQNAHTIQLGIPLPGDTSKSQSDVSDVLEECGYTADDWEGEFAYRYPETRPRGLWWKVQGNGRRYRATTCVPEGTTTYRAHRIHVFESSCGGNCIGGDIARRSCSTFEWDTEPGTLYYILVHKVYMLIETNPPSAPFYLTVTEADTTAVSRAEIFD